MGRLKLFLPLALVVILGVLFYSVVTRIGSGEYQPEALPSALVNHLFPSFTLPQLEDSQQQITEQSLQGEIAIVNVWATWCPSCHAEHGYLNSLAQAGVIKIVGINYKDTSGAAQHWLQEKGNPYVFNIFDQYGQLGLDLGVTGAPETFLIDHRGFVRLRYQGPLNEKIWQQKFRPVVEQLRAEQQSS